MAHRAVMSVMGLYRWNEEIFDDFSIPAELDKEVLTGLILSQCAEMEVTFTDPKIFKEVVKYWSTSRLHAWQRIWDVLSKEYDPIWNKDSRIVEDVNTTSEDLGRVAGFNSDTLNPANKNEGEGTSHLVRTEQGNIGVTMVQSMISKEVDVRKKFNLYQIIIDEFKYQFCISVY